MAETSSSTPKGPIRRVFHNVIDLVSTRIELVRLEVAEQEARLVQLIVLGAFAASLFFAAMVSGVLLLAYVLPDHLRIIVLSITTLALFFACAMLIRSLIKNIRHAPKPFAACVAEIKKDLSALKGDYQE